MTSQPALSRGQNDAMVKGQIVYLPTAEAYDLWSMVYDTDGNFLQALDSIEMQELLPRATSLLPDVQINAIDLGCGTGRNTLRLLEIPNVKSVTGLELSPKMMDVAKSRCEEKSQQSNSKTILNFEIFDMVTAQQKDGSIELPGNVKYKEADLVISTLVIEHIPAQEFFATVSALLKPGGVLILTNMHARMGDISQAGFVDPKTGNKIRPVSYNHEVQDVISMGSRYGLDLVTVDGNEPGVKEISVDEALAEKLGTRGKKWIGVTVWFGGIWRKRTKDDRAA